jgi:hypothetical protein
VRSHEAGSRISKACAPHEFRGIGPFTSTRRASNAFLYALQWRGFTSSKRVGSATGCVDLPAGAASEGGRPGGIFPLIRYDGLMLSRRRQARFRRESIDVRRTSSRMEIIMAGAHPPTTCERFLCTIAELDK